MADLEPLDFDPFGSEAPSSGPASAGGGDLQPLDFDPFGEDAPGRGSAYARGFVRGAGEVAAGALEGSALAYESAARAPAGNLSREAQGLRDQLAEFERQRAGMQDGTGQADLYDRSIAQLRERIAGIEAQAGQAAQREPVLPEDYALYGAGEAVRDALPQRIPQYQDELGSKVAEGFGSAAAFLLGGMATGGAGAAALGATSAGAGVYREARDAGASEQDALLAAQIAGLAGSSEAIPVISWLSRRGGAGWQAFVKKVAVDASEEAAQEGMQGTIQNLIAQGIYDPERGTFENVPESMLVGAIVGGGVGAPMALRESQADVDARARAAQAEEVRRETPAEAAPAPATPPAPEAAPQAPDVAPGVSARFGPPPPKEVEDAAEDAAWLLPAGYSPADVLDMSPAERAASVAEAQEQGVERMGPTDAYIAMRNHWDATERPDSEFVTEEDRASPIPTGLIDDGKRIIDDAVKGKAPAQPQRVNQAGAEAGGPAGEIVFGTGQGLAANGAGALQGASAFDYEFADYRNGEATGRLPFVRRTSSGPVAGMVDATRDDSGRPGFVGAAVPVPEGATRQQIEAAQARAGLVLDEAKRREGGGQRISEIISNPPRGAAAEPIREGRAGATANSAPLGLPSPAIQVPAGPGQIALRPDEQAPAAAARDPRRARELNIFTDDLAPPPSPALGGFGGALPPPRQPVEARAAARRREMQDVEDAEVIPGQPPERPGLPQPRPAAAQRAEGRGRAPAPGGEAIPMQNRTEANMGAPTPPPAVSAPAAAAAPRTEDGPSGGRDIPPPPATDPTAPEAAAWWKGLPEEDRAARLAAAGYDGKKANPAWPFIKKGVRERILSSQNRPQQMQDAPRSGTDLRDGKRPAAAPAPEAAQNRPDAGRGEQDEVRAENQRDIAKSGKPVRLKDGADAFTTFGETNGRPTAAIYTPDGDLIGSTSFYRHDDGAHTASSLFVNPEFRRKGAATALYDRAEAEGLVLKPEPRSNKISDDARAMWEARRKRGQKATPNAAPSRPLPRAVVTPDGQEVGVSYEVVRLDDLKAASGDLQPRDRSRKASDEQIAEIAARLDPERLMPAREADRGAPVVGPDGIVESGNGRVAAIRRARETNPAAYRRYLEAMRAAGFPLKDGEALVARRTSDLSADQRRAFVSGANRSATARMSATEQAQVDMDAMTPAVMAQHNATGDLGSSLNSGFVRGFLANLPQSERAALIDEGGRLNAEGRRRIQHALFAKAYGERDLIARVAEGDGDAAQSLLNAMIRVAPKWAAYRARVGAGEVKPEFDLTPNLVDALRLVTKAREDAARQNRPVATVLREALASSDIFSGSVDPRTAAFVRAFYRGDAFRQAFGVDDLAALLEKVAEEAQSAGAAGPSLFGSEAQAEPVEVVDAARRRIAGAEGDLFGGGEGRGREGDRVGAREDRQQPQERKRPADAPEGDAAAARGGEPGEVAPPARGSEADRAAETLNTSQMLRGLPEGARFEEGDGAALGRGRWRVVDASGEPLGGWRITLREAADDARRQQLTAISPPTRRKPKTPSPIDRAENYFRPGRIVPAYGGKQDRVLAFERAEDGAGFSVRVQEVDADGNPSGRVRTHATLPEPRVLAAWEKENPVGSWDPDSEVDADSSSVRRDQRSGFGPVLTGFEGNWRGAALELERRRTGEAPGALSHPEIGPIALVWGKEGAGRSDGYGLAKLIAWHPEVLDDLQGRIERMTISSRSENRIQLRGESDQAGVRLDWDGQAKTWLIAAYDRGAPRRSERSTASLRDLWGDLAPSPRRGADNVRSNGPDSNTRERQSSADGFSAITPEMTARLQERLTRLTGLGRVRLVIDPAAQGGALRRSRNRDGIEVDGTFAMNRDASGRLLDSRVLIGASLDPQKTLDHEAIHALYHHGLFMQTEWNALTRRARAVWIRKHNIRARYPDGDEALWIEEAIAEEFATWAAGRRRSVAPETAGAFEKIRRLLEAVGNFLRGEGLQSVEAVFERVDRGGVGAREEIARDARGRFTSRERRSAPAAPFQTFEARTRRELMSMFAPRNWSRLRQASSWDDLRTWAARNMSDRFVDLKRQQEAIASAAGAPIALSQDAYLAESLYHGRTAERLEKFYEQDVKGLMDLIHEAGLSQREVDDYLRARHVRERNAQIAKLYEFTEPDSQFARAATEDDVAGGSGKSNRWADEQLRQAHAGPSAAALREIGRRVDAINRAKLAADVEAGLLSQEAADAMLAAYRHYVPLRGEEGQDEEGAGAVGTGRGYQAPGPETRRALGRSTESDSPLAYVFAQRASGIVRAEKNRVAKTFLRLVEGNPNPSLWQVNRVEKKRGVRKAWVETGVDPLTGLPVMERRDVATERAQGPNPMDPNVLTVKVGGDPIYVTVSDPAIPSALKNLNAQNGNALVDMMSRATRFLAAMNTSWNPEWFIVNMARDLQAAGIQINDEQRRGMTKALAKNYLPALRGAFEYHSGTGDSEWKAIAEDFAMQGGRVNFVDFRTVEDFKAAIQGEVTTNKLERMVRDGVKPVKAIFKGIETLTSAGENGVRIAAYKAALDAGMPKAKAASLARELTVNFNRRGDMGPAMNAFYMFYNAAVQGNIRSLRSIMTSGIARKAAMGFAAAGFAEALLGALDDDEYEKIEPWVRERNIVIMLAPLGLGGPGQYAKIPIPYFYNVAKVAGTEAGRAMLLGTDPAEGAVSLAHTLLNSFNPIGGQDLIATITPTLADPIMELARNENFFGSQIMPREYPGDTTPDSRRYFPNVSEVSKSLTAWLNDSTGGNAFRPGWIDVSPETIDHLFGFATGGAGRLALNAEQTVRALLGEDLPDAERAPFVRQVYGRTLGDMPTYRAYSRISDDLAALRDEIEGFAKAGDREAVRRARERDPVATRMLEPFKATDKLIRQLRKTERTVRASGMAEDVKEQRVEALRKQQHEIRLRALETWFRATEEGEGR